MQSNFITSALQITATLITITLPIAQYIFRDGFKFLFRGDNDIFNISTVVALLFSFAIIVILYANRYSLGNKIYLSNDKKRKYFEELLKNNNLQTEQGNQVGYVTEPFFLNVYRLAIISIGVALLVFIVIIIYSENNIIVSIGYVMFISLVIFSITTFAVKLYIEGQYQIKNREVDDLILEKIKSYFVGEMKIISIFTDNRFPSLKYVKVKYKDDVEYIAKADAMDPNQYFEIEEQKQSSGL